MQILTQPTPQNTESIDDRVAALLQAGTNITLNYDDVTNTLTISASGGSLDAEAVQDLVAAQFPDSTTIDFSYNDTSGVITAEVRVATITEQHIVFSDVTSDNASTLQHGLLPKLSGNTMHFLRGDGTWVAPAISAAPVDAEYITGTANATLSAERVLTDTATVTWDRSTPGQVKANAVSYTNEQAQDAVGTILVDSATINFTYSDATPSISATIPANSITESHIVLSDVTSDNATSLVHGFLPKLSGGTTLFLRGDGTWAIPTATPDTEATQDIVGAMFVDTLTVNFSYSDELGQITADLIPNSITLNYLPTINVPPKVLGRYTAGPGNTQEMGIGNDFNLNTTSGELSTPSRFLLLGA